eukprot:4915912-Karenia_brevis.AAC.1
MASPWHATIAATDASEEGLGVCRRTVAVVGSLGRNSARWRYDFEGSVNARSSALDDHSCPGSINRQSWAHVHGLSTDTVGID